MRVHWERGRVDLSDVFALLDSQVYSTFRHPRSFTTTCGLLLRITYSLFASSVCAYLLYLAADSPGAYYIASCSYSLFGDLVSAFWV